MVNRNAKNGYKIVKKDHINVACELRWNRLQAVRISYRIKILETIRWILNF